MDDILEEAKRENIIEVNSRNQDRYRFKTTLETLTEDIAEKSIEKRNVQSELLKKESILTKLKEKKEKLETDIREVEDEDEEDYDKSD